MCQVKYKEMKTHIGTDAGDTWDSRIRTEKEQERTDIRLHVNYGDAYWRVPAIVFRTAVNNRGNGDYSASSMLYTSIVGAGGQVRDTTPPHHQDRNRFRDK